AALRHAVNMLDSEGNLDWWNRAAETLLGLKTPQYSGQPVTNLVRHPRFNEYFALGNNSDPLEITSPTSDRVRNQLQI
ncbi:PAS domain-containing protein, partial [Pseudomonas syringae group genomosp. 7]|uniref:PAS domain-containing protein n=1 Tax=Pseudomonas syringae group genomosp. 7 TaxID=251699 RepID=UPI00377042B7